MVIAKKSAARRPSSVAVAAKKSPPKRTSVKKPLPVKKPLVKAATPPTKKPEKAQKTAVVKIKKAKLVRDSFTMPKTEYAVIDELKTRASKLGHPVKKSELLRAAIKQIAALSDTALIAAMSAVPPIKTGRPRKA